MDIAKMATNWLMTLSTIYLVWITLEVLVATYPGFLRRLIFLFRCSSLLERAEKVHCIGCLLEGSHTPRVFLGRWLQIDVLFTDHHVLVDKLKSIAILWGLVIFQIHIGIYLLSIHEESGILKLWWVVWDYLLMLVFDLWDLLLKHLDLILQ